MRAICFLALLWACSAFADVPAGYPTVACATENGTCKIAAPGTLVFGDAKSGKFDPPMHVTADTVCSLASFGRIDPIYLTVKACYFLPDPLPFIVGQVPIVFVPQQVVPVAPPASAAQMIFPAASAPGCIGPAVGRTWRDATNQYWATSCQKKGYVFWFGQAASVPANGVVQLQQPTGFATEQTQ